MTNKNSWKMDPARHFWNGINWNNTPTYASWVAMRQRCIHLPDHIYQQNGIKICEEWDSFDTFLKDMGERPAGTTLDRIDVYGDYGPSNCRWSSKARQNRNIRKKRVSFSPDRKNQPWTVMVFYTRHILTCRFADRNVAFQFSQQIDQFIYDNENTLTPENLRIFTKTLKEGLTGGKKIRQRTI